SKKSGGSWQATSQVASCSGPSSTTPCPAGQLPNRYISGVRIDTAHPNHAYLTLSGYSRKWMIGPGDDPAVGHVFETTDGGSTWNDISVGLPDVPMDDIVLQGNGRLDVATDFGVFTSSDDGATWDVLGTKLPNVVVDQLTLDPTGKVLIAATHGRGVWTLAAPCPSGMKRGGRRTARRPLLLSLPSPAPRRRCGCAWCRCPR